MSDPTLTVPTAFTDISQLAEGLADRVDEGRLMLYGPQPYDEGAWVRFEVLLADQSAAIEGTGRAVTSIDGGEERPEVARWDIVLDSLEFDGTGEVVYERILMVRGNAFGAEPTGEVSLDEVEHLEDDVAEAHVEDVQAVGDAPYEVQGTGEEFVDESTMVAQQEDYQVHVAASVMEEEPPSEQWAAPPVEEPAGEVEQQGWGDEYGQPSAFGEPTGSSEALPAGDELEPSHGAGLAAAEAAPEEPAALEGMFEDPGLAMDADRAAGAHEDLPTGEIEVDDLISTRSAATGSEPPSAPLPPPPREPGGFHIEPIGANGSVLSRPSRESGWYPMAEDLPEPMPSSGLFAFAGGLPVPPKPPRPDLDPSLRIEPAPRPEGGAPAPQAHQDYGATARHDLPETVEGDLDDLERDGAALEPADAWHTADPSEAELLPEDELTHVDFDEEER